MKNQKSGKRFTPFEDQRPPPQYHYQRWCGTCMDFHIGKARSLPLPPSDCDPKHMISKYNMAALKRRLVRDQQKPRRRVKR